MRFRPGSFAGLLGLVSFALSSAPAAACGRPPLPPWHDLVGEKGPPVWIGRVNTVTPNRTRYVTEDIVVRQSTASIETLERIYGKAPDIFEFVGSTDVRFRTAAGALWCGLPMTVEPGDVVLIVPSDTFGAYIMKPDEAPPEARARLGAYR